MADEIYVAPAAAAAVIRFGGTCYYRVGPTDVFPDIFSATPFSSCEECAGSSSSSGGGSETSSGSSSSSSEAPAPCCIMDDTDEDCYIPPDDPGWGPIQLECYFRVDSTEVGDPTPYDCNLSLTLEYGGSYLWSGWTTPDYPPECYPIIGAQVELIETAPGVCAWKLTIGGQLSPVRADSGSGGGFSLKMSGNTPVGTYPDINKSTDTVYAGNTPVTDTVAVTGIVIS